MEAAVIGDIVKIKPEWLGPHETPGKLYRVMYANYETKRLIQHGKIKIHKVSEFEFYHLHFQLYGFGLITLSKLLSHF